MPKFGSSSSSVASCHLWTTATRLRLFPGFPRTCSHLPSSSFGYRADRCSHCLTTTALGPFREYLFDVPLRHRGRRGSLLLLPQEQPPLDLEAARSCGCRLTLFRDATTCWPTSSAQLRRQVGLHVRSDCPHGLHSLRAHQGQGPPLRRSPDVRGGGLLGEIQYRASIIDRLLTDKGYPHQRSFWGSVRAADGRFTDGRGFWSFGWARTRSPGCITCISWCMPARTSRGSCSVP